MSAVFFASGAAALVLETLLFHQVRLVLGSSVSAVVLVPAGFMLGLGLGNAAAMRCGDRVTRPLQAYAALEVLAGVSGVALVVALPALASAAAPLLRPFVDRATTLAALRFVFAFVLLLAPATAMGLTLPLVTRALAARGPGFGSVLGWLYGWNTLGAVAGTVLAETVLIGWVGLRGTALFAGVLGLLAAIGALSVSRRWASPPLAPAAPGAPAWWRSGRCLAAAFLSGFALLAAEVVWFRFLSLYVPTRSLGFALMLAVVLAGIALGGLAASAWLREAPGAGKGSAAVAWAAGAMIVAGYALAPAALERFGIVTARRPGQILELGAPLMLPVSMLSGALFTLLGDRLHAERGRDASTAGLLTLFNTAGAALGAVLAGFVALPALGVERTFLVLALVYAVVGLLLVPARGTTARRASALAGAALAAALTFFPRGSMDRHLEAVRLRLAPPPRGQVHVREGLVETVQVVERTFAGQTRSQRLLTNGISMSASDFRNRRYMKLFVVWPVAIHPGLRSALLISYGVGATARALADTRELDSIDVVDISRDILGMSEVFFPDPARQPLRDPRVRVHVEDGRFFLQTTDRVFDLITGEPPPPDLDGVVNLYSREYFALVREHLAEGGITTYWLPTHSLSEDNARAVIRAFCDAFPDCSLWNGAGSDWMLAGTRGVRGPVSEERFRAQWADPVVAPELSALGLESPEALGALFLADADALREVTAGVAPVVDDFPRRIVPPLHYGPIHFGGAGLYGAWSDTAAARSRFLASPFVARLWPAPLLGRSADAFAAQALVNHALVAPSPEPADVLADVHAMLTTTSLRGAVAWRLGSDSDVQSVLAGLTGEARDAPEPALHEAIERLAARRYADALAPLALAAARPEQQRIAALLRAYVLSALDRHDEAAQVVADARARWGAEPTMARALDGLRNEFASLPAPP